MQRNNKHFILGNLGVPGHTHLKGQYHFEETFDNYQQEKISFIFHIFLKILERYCKFVFSGTLNMPGFAHPRWYYQFVEGRKSNTHPMIFWRYCKDTQIYFGYFGHVWLYTAKIIVSTCRRVLFVGDVYLNAKNKVHQSLPLWDITF